MDQRYYRAAATNSNLLSPSAFALSISSGSSAGSDTMGSIFFASNATSASSIGLTEINCACFDLVDDFVCSLQKMSLAG